MQQSVEQLLDKARALQSRGDVKSALRQYEEAMVLGGHHPVIAAELVAAQMAGGRTQAALKAARQAVHRHPDHAGARVLLAQVLAHLGDAKSALVELDAARRLDPRMAEIPAMQGALHGMMNEHFLSEKAFEEALSLMPAHPGLLANLGHARKAQGRFTEAVAAYREALDKDPEALPVLMSYADALGRVGRLNEGIDVMRRALVANPGSPELHHALGNLYHDEGRLDEAVAEHEAALRLRPDFADAAYNLGMVEMDLRRWERAAAALERAVHLDPHSVDVQTAYATAVFNLGDHDRALDVVTAAVAGTQSDDLRLTWAHMVRTRERYDEAIDSYRKVIASRDAARDDMYWEARLNLALTHHLAGRPEEGWSLYASREDRLRKARADPRALVDPIALFAHPPAVAPAVFADRDQGIGDTLFFLRFAPAAAQKFPRLAVRVDAKLHPLMHRIGGPFRLVEEIPAEADCSVRLWIPDFTLAAPSSCPPAVPLCAREDLVAEARADLARCGPGPYVGVTWRAGLRLSETADDVRRFVKQIEPRSFGRALSGSGGTVIVLQRGMSPLEASEFAAGLGRPAFDFSGYSDDLERMLAVLSVLDDYVTVSNTNVHMLAGLPEKDARILVPQPAEWRWGSRGERSPWFPRFRIYREAIEGWDPPLEQLARDLRERFGPAQAGSAGGEVVPVRPARLVTRDNPSPRYRELLRVYQQMHLEGEPASGTAAGDALPGQGLRLQARRIRTLVEKHAARTLLDYGSGKGKQWRDTELPGVGRVNSVREFVGVEAIRCFDPAYPPFSERPDGSYDGVIAIDVLERCPEEDLEWVVGDLFGYARKFVFASVASYPASEQLPNGENVHVTQRGARFWSELFHRVGRAHPGIAWELYVTLRAPSGGLVHKRLGGAAPML